MINWKTIAHWGGIFYVLINVIDVLFIPAEVLGFGDNIFFPFALLTAFLIVLKDNRTTRLLTWSIGGYTVFIFCAQLLSNTGLHLSVIPNLLLWTKWACILLITYDWIKNHGTQQFNLLLLILFIPLVLMNLFMLLNPIDLGETVQHLYSSSVYTDFVYYNEPGTFRLAGTQKNPNDNAVIFALFLFLFSKKPRQNWAFIVICIGMILLAQSRTVALGLMVITILYGLVQLMDKKLRKKLILVGLPIFLVMLILVFNSNYLSSILNGDAFVSNSFLIRFEHLSVLTQNDLQHILCGTGVILSPINQLGFDFDSEYFGLLFQFGVIGLICWLFIQVSLMLIAVKQKNFSLLGMVLFILMVSATNFTFFHPQLGVFFAFSLGVLLFNDKALNQTT